MKEEELLNIIQPVLRGIVLAIVSTDPGKLAVVSKTLLAVSNIQPIDERSRQMLADLAAGLEMIAAVDVRKS
jgi:hypothetical protein